MNTENRGPATCDGEASKIIPISNKHIDTPGGRARQPRKPRKGPIAALSVYDDKHKIGEIEDLAPHQIKAIAVVHGRRKSIGIFPSRKDAMRAIDGLEVVE